MRPNTVAGKEGSGQVKRRVRSRNLSIRNTERLAAFEFVPRSAARCQVCRYFGRDDQVSIHGRSDGPLQSSELNVEYVTPEWVDWFINRRLLEAVGYIPPAEVEAYFFSAMEPGPHGRVTNEDRPLAMPVGLANYLPPHSPSLHGTMSQYRHDVLMLPHQKQGGKWISLNGATFRLRCGWEIHAKGVFSVQIDNLQYVSVPVSMTQ